MGVKQLAEHLISMGLFNNLPAASFLMPAVARIKEEYTRYCGPKIPGLWEISRRVAGKRVLLDRFVLPNHPLVNYGVDFTERSSMQARDLMRDAVRLGHVDKDRLRIMQRGSYQLYKRPWDRGTAGDRFMVKRRQRVPFNIVLAVKAFDRSKVVDLGSGPRLVSKIMPADAIVTCERWDAYSTLTKAALLCIMFNKLNDNLQYLSGERFGLQLRGIEVVEDPDGVFGSPDNGGFTMVVANLHSRSWGHYLARGCFTVDPSGLFLDSHTLSTGIIVHEMMHGLLGEGHSTLKGNVYSKSRSKRIPQEAAFLGWPSRPPVDSTIELRGI